MIAMAQGSTARTSSDQLAKAYRVCRATARREAKNFYYAFLALPAAKHNAICAVYAFMRHADDLSDDESLPASTRLRTLQLWMEKWGEAAATGDSANPVFIALNDARLRFNIPLTLLDELVQGTAMDLDPARAGDANLTYQTFDELYRYCYMVASVVGLVCIRIFGYTDPGAEILAEELGIAFQLTNILRDVREDAERGRIYLPLDDLRSHGVEPALFATPDDAARYPAMQRLLAFEGVRAERFYVSGRLLLPLIAPDSRPALWVLMTIYHRLHERVTKAGAQVWLSRASVPSYEKVAILAQGLLGIARYRLFGSR